MKKFLKSNKLLAILLLLTIITMISAILFHAMLDDNNKKIIIDNIHKLLIEKEANIGQLIINNNLYTISVWILGISIIGMIIVLAFYLLKVFILFFEFTSFLTTLKLKNILGIIIYFMPNMIFVILSFFITYYSIYYSISLVQSLFFHKKKDFSFMTKKYIKILLINILINCVIAIIDYFIKTRLFFINL